MADSAFRFQAWCREHQAALEKELHALRSGKVHVSEKQGEQQVDKTGATISRIQGRLDELKDLLFDT